MRTNNILKLYRSATVGELYNGEHWYDEARYFCAGVAVEHGLELGNVVCALAHLSPRVTWAQNKRKLIQVITLGDTYGIRSHVSKARESLYSATPFDTFGEKAYKTSRFARNIIGDYQPVTVDTWAAKAATGRVVKDISKGLYLELEDTYQRAAKSVGTTPAQLQAVVWCVIRGKAD